MIKEFKNMRKYLKSIVAGACLIGSLLSANAASFAFTSTTTDSGPAYLISTNRASVYSIELTSATAGWIHLYDSDNTNAPFRGTNYTNSAWVSRNFFTTNYYTTNVGANGVTNFYTNVGITTVNITNAASTNVLPSMGDFVVAGGTYAVYPMDALFSRGISATCSSNLSVVIYYRTAQ